MRMGVLLGENRSITPCDDSVPFPIFAQKRPTNGLEVPHGMGSPEKPIETNGWRNLAEARSAKMEIDDVIFVRRQKVCKRAGEFRDADYVPWSTGTVKHGFACQTFFR